MRVIVTLDQRYLRAPDGVVWTTTTHAYGAWARYLSVFDHVQLVARVADVASVPEWAKRVDGEDVSVAPMPFYLGPWQYLRKARRIANATRQALGPEDAVVMRVPCPVSTQLERAVRREGRPYGVEVLGDPYDVFAPGVVDHPLRPFLRWWIPRLVRRQCANACAAAFVTRETLQRRYPPAPGAFSIGCSDVDLPEAAFAEDLRPPMPPNEVPTVVWVGALALTYKGPDTLIDACSICKREGLAIRAVLVGGGGLLPAMRARAEAMGIGREVCFVGDVPAGSAVRRFLDAADLFALPSRTEGLPRALLEAMARGLPCIASTVGGIPELLPPEDMVPPNDPAALARKLRETLTDPARLSSMSARNLQRARSYRSDALRAEWTAFYRQVRECTEAWIARR